MVRTGRNIKLIFSVRDDTDNRNIIVKPHSVTLSQTTLKNTKSIEYQWVRILYVSGYSEQQINRYIQQCFGGDPTFANLFRRVALSQENLAVLLTYAEHFELSLTGK